MMRKISLRFSEGDQIERKYFWDKESTKKSPKTLFCAEKFQQDKNPQERKY